MKLTARMLKALKQTKAGPLRRVHNPTVPGRPPWPAHAATLAALVRHELVTRSRTKNAKRYDVDLWSITDKGRAALEPRERVKEKKDEYLAPRYGNTGDPRRGLDYELATVTTRDGRRVQIRNPVANVDPADLDDRWRRRSEREHADAQDRREAVRKLTRNARAA